MISLRMRRGLGSLGLFVFLLFFQVEQAIARPVVMEPERVTLPTLLALGSEGSEYLQLLEEHHKVSRLAINGTLPQEEKQAQLEQIKQADVLFIDVGYETQSAMRDDYLEQVRKWQKPIFIAAAHKHRVAAWPMQFESPLVLMMPQKSGADIIVSFNHQYEVYKQASTARLSQGVPALYDVTFDKRIAYSSPLALSSNDHVPTLSLTRINAQLNAQLNRVLERPLVSNQAVSLQEDVNHLKTPKIIALSKDSYMSTGGQVGYPCPAKAKDEHLCYSAIVMSDLYLFEQDGAKLNVVHGYSFAAYRTELGTSIFVSPFGSANPTLTQDTDSDRGFFLKQVKPEIKVTASGAAGLMLFKRSPENQNGTDRVSTSSGMGLSLSGIVSNNPSLGASISYSQSRSQMTNLTDWRTFTYSNTGYDANWDYRFNKYVELEDWVVDKLLSTKVRLKEVPVISAHGLQYSAEAIWFGSRHTVSGIFEFKVTTEVVNERLHFTKNNLLDWEISSTHFTHGLYTGAERFNTDWLKTL